MVHKENSHIFQKLQKRSVVRETETGWVPVRLARQEGTAGQTQLKVQVAGARQEGQRPLSEVRSPPARGG